MKTRAAVHFILTALVLCAAAFCYLKFYYAFRATEGSLLHRVKENLVWALAFGGTSVVWFINWVSVNIKYSRIRRIYGAYFGGILGRLLLLVELAGYVLVIIFLFI